MINLYGIFIGAAAFFIIGIFHPIVIKCEYFFGKRVWPVFLFSGISAIILSIFINNVVVSAVTGIFGFASIWGVKELFEQEKRVDKGWYPKHPEREY